MDDPINLWLQEPNQVLHQSIGKLSEELSEANKACARCIIQGFDARDPVSGKPNSEALLEELADVLAALKWLTEIKPGAKIGNSEEFDKRIERKLEGFRRWQRMIEERGAA